MTGRVTGGVTVHDLLGDGNLWEAVGLGLERGLLLDRAGALCDGGDDDVTDERAGVSRIDEGRALLETDVDAGAAVGSASQAPRTVTAQSMAPVTAAAHRTGPRITQPG